MTVVKQDGLAEHSRLIEDCGGTQTEVKQVKGDCAGPVEAEIMLKLTLLAEALEVVGPGGDAEEHDMATAVDMTVVTVEPCVVKVLLIIIVERDALPERVLFD